MPQELLIRGIWPRSTGFWAVCFYMVLYIVRPWEKLIPELGEVKFERYATLIVLAIVVTKTGFRLRFDAPTIGILLFTAALGISAIDAVDSARTVYLQCSTDTLTQRIRRQPGDRPSLTGADPAEEMAVVLAEREPVYRAVADLIVDANDSTAQSYSHTNLIDRGHRVELRRLLVQRQLLFELRSFLKIKS